MNLKLSEGRIRATCRELLQRDGAVSGRSLRRELHNRFGATGKTERVFQIWREESGYLAATALPPEVRELQQRVLAAESAAAENLARAERAEYREQAHQDYWAVEVDRLRQAAQRQPDATAQIRELQEQVFKLSRELDAARSGR